MCWLDRSKCSHLTWVWQLKWERCFATSKKGEHEARRGSHKVTTAVHPSGRFQVCSCRRLPSATADKLSNQGSFQIGLFSTTRPHSPTLELDRDALLHAVSWLISRTGVAKGHALIFLCCLWSVLLLWFGFYLATTLCMTQLLGVTCLLFCWEKAEKQQRYWQIEHSPTLACSEKALPLGWQMPGTGRSAEISVYLIFSPPFTLDFSLLYVHKTPRQLISALWPLLIGLCERKAAPAGEITHTCYFELSCHFPSPCLQELQAPFCEPGLLYFHRHSQDQQEGPQVFHVVVLPLNSSRYRDATKRHVFASPSVQEGESDFWWRKHNLKALMALLPPTPSCSSLPLSASLLLLLSCPITAQGRNQQMPSIHLPISRD